MSKTKKMDRRARIKKSLFPVHEGALIKRGFFCIAGVDEVGRGAWAGPLIAAAVVIRSSNFQFPIFKNLGIRDSKKLTAKKREEIYKTLCRSGRSRRISKRSFEKFGMRFFDWAIGEVAVSEINKLGLAKAGILALKRAVKNLKIKPDYLLIDAFKIPEIKIPQKSIIKGDEKVFSVALASIIAKVTRDRIMMKLSKKYPQYGFVRHKGYGTKMHQEALKKHGPCPEHRASYKPIKDFL